jgi:hypothetical protein
MSVEKEIGLIQIRTGKQRNLPKALEQGELAFTTDECRAFVGLPSSITPASLVAGRTKSDVPGSAEENVEILTEFTPQHVINRALYRAVKVTLPPATWKTTKYIDEFNSITTNGLFTLSIPSADRLFIDYTAFTLGTTGTSTAIETGTIHVILVDGAPVISQHSYSSDPGGISWVSSDIPTLSGSITKVPIKNRNNLSMQFEYIYRGWQEPI